MKNHILLIENKDNELDFFTEALKKSKLNFLCSIAKSEEQPIRILKNIVPDIIFIDLNTAGSNSNGFLRNLVNTNSAYVVLNSSVCRNMATKTIHQKISHCIHLPANTKAMSFMLQNLLNS